MRIRRAVLAVGVLGAWLAVRGGPRPAPAAEPKHTLRIATAAPKGTQWARDFELFVKEVADATGGELAVKVYYGGVAGDEEEAARRLAAGQLDGAISGGPLCANVIPSMRVMGVVGLFQTQDEATHVVGELKPQLAKEAHANGYTLLATGSVGPIIMFSREPIASMEAFRKAKLWTWDLNTIFIMMAAEMKLNPFAGSLLEAARAFDDGRTEGYWTTPTAAVAFQWFVGTRYITDLRTGYLMGCLLVRQASVDALPPEHQAALAAAGAKLGVRIEHSTRRQNDELLGGIFQKQGLKLVTVSEKFRAEFFEAARLARERLGEKIVPKALLEQVLRLLADYRAEHG